MDLHRVYKPGLDQPVSFKLPIQWKDRPKSLTILCFQSYSQKVIHFTIIGTQKALQGLKKNDVCKNATLDLCQFLILQIHFLVQS